MYIVHRGLTCITGYKTDVTFSLPRIFGVIFFPCGCKSYIKVDETGQCVINFKVVSVERLVVAAGHPAFCDFTRCVLSVNYGK